MRGPSEAALPEFRIFETEEFLKRLKKLSSRDASFLRRKLDSFVYPQLKAEPFWGNNIKKLDSAEKPPADNAPRACRPRFPAAVRSAMSARRARL